MTMYRVGMPHSLWLDEFGSYVWHAFGHCPYLVGSALTNDLAHISEEEPKDRRPINDVDVRLILPDDEYAAQFGDPAQSHRNGKWVAMCLAFSELGRRITQLPIDFQIQQQTRANTMYDNPRSAVGLVPRMVESVEKT